MLGRSNYLFVNLISFKTRDRNNLIKTVADLVLKVKMEKKKSGFDKKSCQKL